MKRYIAVLLFLIFSLNIAKAQDNTSIADSFLIAENSGKESTNGEDFTSGITRGVPVIPKTWLRVGIGGTKNRIFLERLLFAGSAPHSNSRQRCLYPVQKDWL